MEQTAENLRFKEPSNYKEWAETLGLTVDNDLTEDEYLRKRDATKSHKTERGFQKAIHNLAKSSVLNSLKRAIEAVDVLTAVSLNSLKIKDSAKYEEIISKGGKNNGKE